MESLDGVRTESKPAQRRVLVKDLEGRVRELENKISDLAAQIQKLDLRLQQMANSIAAAQAARM
jgi:chaperonin cofactor prefoldin